MRPFFRWLVQLFCPRKCVLCGRGLPTGTAAMLCTGCAPILRREYRCHTPVSVRGADGADAPLLYHGRVAAALRRYKFYGGTALCRWFAAQTAACLSAHLTAWQPEVITYVPLGAGRWWNRGYNQSKAVAYETGKALGLPVAPMLGKRPFRGKQSHRTGRERRQVQGAFFPLPHCKANGRRVVLIDDVITTGFTAADAVRALREGGAEKVFVLAMTRTDGRPREASAK